MPDSLTKEQRHKNMVAIKSKDTSLETKVRKYLWHHGFRYRKNVKELPGTPDIVLRRYNVVIFINGCFWHNHYNCRLAVMPKTNTEFWIKKIERNVQRDTENCNQLRQLGYKVLVVWECEIKDAFEATMKTIMEEIVEETMS